MKNAITDKPINWRDILPPGWEGKCCWCKRKHTEAHWSGEELIAVVEGPAIVTVCAHHYRQACPAVRARIARRVAYCLQQEHERLFGEAFHAYATESPTSPPPNKQE